MEGYWFGGKWCPPELYHYINFWHIEVENEKKTSSGKITGRPWFRDLEWEKANVATEAFGFSGFELDEKYTCNHYFKPDNIRDSIARGKITLVEAEHFIYEDPRYYINKYHEKNLGKPLYHNPAKNVIDIEARGGGKSFWGSNLIACNFHFDGSHDYDDYHERRKSGKAMVSQTLVGAIQASYSADLLGKYKFGVENYPGSFRFGYGDDEIYFPPPFSVSTQGSLEPGKEPLLAKHSSSKLFHRTFQDKAFAANGTRPGRAFLEEIGFFFRLLEALGAMKDLTYNGSFKFGTIWMFGTGGDMEGGSTLAAQEVFYNPEAYDCLVFQDKWEGRGNIGYFLPAEKALNDFKEGPNYITNMEAATAQLEKDRAKAKAANSPVPYNKELQNRPRKPSEAFLAINENKFPIKLVEDSITKLKSKKSELGSHWTGFIKLREEEDGEVSLKWEHSSNRPLRVWPIKIGEQVEGCIEIFEMPKRDHTGVPVWGRYIGGTDPVDDDGVEGSMQSTFIFDMWTERIVAEYTARTPDVEDYWENIRLLFMYYNAECAYESQKKGLYGHFKNKSSLHLLADTPTILRDLDLAVIKDEGNKSKGIYASASINEYGRKLYNIWLRKDAIGKEGLKNAQCLRSLGLSMETNNYNPKGNFDRISAVEKLFILYADRIQYAEGSRETLNEAAAGLAADPFFKKNYERWLKKNGRRNFTKINQALKSA